MTNAQFHRYGRHLVLPEVGVHGQEKLLAGKVLLIGCGGLGSPVSLYLAAAGVGTIGLVDFDTIDVSNLQRQILFSTDQVGQLKAEVAAERLRALNPDVDVRVHLEALSSENAMELFRDYDYIIDGTDNFPTRYLVNDACVLSGKINVYGSIFRFDGQATVFGHPDGPCYRCLFPDPPKPHEVPNCSEGGVLGVLPGLVGLVQANEAIKLIAGIGDPLIGRLQVLDALSMRWREMKVEKDPNCPLCGEHRTITELVDYQEFCGFSMLDEEETVKEITPEELRARLGNGWNGILLDVREPEERVTGEIDGAVVMPVNELVERLFELDEYRDREIVVYCQGGVRSISGVKILQGRGFQAVSLKNGFRDWLAEEPAPGTVLSA